MVSLKEGQGRLPREEIFNLSSRGWTGSRQQGKRTGLWAEGTACAEPEGEREIRGPTQGNRAGETRQRETNRHRNRPEHQALKELKPHIMA